MNKTEALENAVFWLAKGMYNNAIYYIGKAQGYGADIPEWIVDALLMPNTDFEKLLLTNKAVEFFSQTQQLGV